MRLTNTRNRSRAAALGWFAFTGLLLIGSVCRGGSLRDQFDAFLGQAYANQQFNGTVLVARQGEVIFHKAYGISSIDPELPLQLDSQFRLASVSKPFTAMAIMILREQGILDYGDRITEYLPELPYQGVSIRHLLTHTSGIPDYTYLFERYWDPAHEIFTEKDYADNDDVITMFVDHQPELLFDPGERYSYSNTGYAFLASIVERATGTPFNVFLRENIFTPLEMSNTLLYSAIRDDPMERRVYGYRLALDGTHRIPNDFHYMSGICGDGAIYSTTGDLFKWDQALYTEILVPRTALAEAFTPCNLNDGSQSYYGLGWGIDTSLTGGRVVSHGGGWISARTLVYREIDDNNCIIVLTNHTSRHFYAICETLKRILHGKPYDPLKPGIADIIAPVLEARGIEPAIGEYYKQRTSHPDEYEFGMWELNWLGNRLAQLGRLTEAIQIYRLNALQFPNNSRVYNDLGDVYQLSSDPEQAASHYRKSLELEPDNGYAQRKLKELLDRD